MKRTYAAWLLWLVPVACLLSVATLPVAGQSGGTTKGEWRAYGGDLANTGIRRSIKSTRRTSRTSKSPGGSRPRTSDPARSFSSKGTPLMANGVVYATAGTRRAVVALDAATGELLWMHSEREGPRGTNAPRQLSGRGLAYWTDGREERILYVTPGYRLRRARREDRDAGGRVRHQRRGRPEDGQRSGDRSRHRRSRAARDADGWQRRRRHRRGAPARRRAARQDEREGVHPRLRRPDGQAALDLSHGPDARRIRQRDVGKGLVEVHRQHRRVGPGRDRRRAQPRLPADRARRPATITAAPVRARTCSARRWSRSI